MTAEKAPIIDCIGQPINVGDAVLWGGGRYADLVQYEVTKINPKTARIKAKGMVPGWQAKDVSRPGSELIVITKLLEAKQ